MAAHDSLGPQFQDQGDSPLDYSWPAKRAALVDPNAGPHPREPYYTPMKMGSTRGGKREMPGAAPGTVSFADYTPMTRGDESELHIHYIRTRSDQQGHGHATALVNQLIAHAQPHAVDFGKIMEPEMNTVREKVEAANPNVRFHHKIDYR